MKPRLWAKAARREGAPPRPLHARALFAPTPTPASSPVGAVGAGLGFAAAAPEKATPEPKFAEPACLGVRWQVTDASLLPRDRAALAGAS